MEREHPSHFDVAMARCCLRDANNGRLALDTQERRALLTLIQSFARSIGLTPPEWRLVRSAFLKQSPPSV